MQPLMHKRGRRAAVDAMCFDDAFGIHAAIDALCLIG